MLTNKRYLALDFDGVMHPETKGKDYFCLKKFLYPVVKKYDLNIIISSAWRTSFDLDGLKKLLGKKLGSHVVGSTPDHSLSMYDLLDTRSIEERIEDEFPSFYGRRQREIEDWIGKNGITSDQWIALDDIPILFAKYCPNLFLTDSEIGLDKSKACEFDLFCGKIFGIDKKIKAAHPLKSDFS